MTQIACWRCQGIYSLVSSSPQFLECVLHLLDWVWNYSKHVSNIEGHSGYIHTHIYIYTLCTPRNELWLYTYTHIHSWPCVAKQIHLGTYIYMLCNYRQLILHSSRVKLLYICIWFHWKEVYFIRNNIFVFVNACR